MTAQILLLIAITLFTYAFYKWSTFNNDYFERRGLKYLKPTFLIGNTGILFFNKLSAVEIAKWFYEKFPDEPIYGTFLFRSPVYFFRDPEIIKRISIKDFDNFAEHQSFANSEVDRLWGNNLFMMKAEKWRDMRPTISPAFTGNKMRQMFELVSECAEDFVKHFSEKAKNGETVKVEVKDTFARYTTDCIATSAFGVKIDSLKYPENEFFVAGKKLMDFERFSMVIRLVMVNKLPKLAKVLNIKLSDGNVLNLFKSIILDTMNRRKMNNVYRPDFLNLLMQVREGSFKQQADDKSSALSDGFATVQESEIGGRSVNCIWDDDELVAQCLVFFLAGYETLSTTLTMASYELVVNQDVQQKLYEEIVQTNERIGGKRITYDALQKMNYLDQVICETLRIWPPVILTSRLCTKDYKYDDGDQLNFTVEKGRELFLPIFAIQRDPKYYNQPEKFDPDRFNEENKKKITPGTYLPFGLGPRACIGSRFALMELKTMLYYLLLNFSLQANEMTEIPITFEKNPFNLQPKNGVNIELQPRKK